MTDEIQAGLDVVEQPVTQDETTQEQPIETNDTEADPVNNDTPELTEAERAEEEKINAIVKKRIHREAKKVAQANQEAEFWKQEALKQKQATEAIPQQPVYDNKPQLAQFNNNWEAYTEAVADWKLQSYVRQQEQVKVQAEQKQLVENYTKREQAFAKVNPDYHEAIADVANVPVHNDIRQVIWESDAGPALAYHLAQHTDEIERLNNLPQHKRLLELGKLEDRFAKKTINKTTTTRPAPAPIKPVGGSAPVISKSIFDMSREELRAHFNAENKAKLAKKFGKR